MFKENAINSKKTWNMIKTTTSNCNKQSPIRKLIYELNELTDDLGMSTAFI